MPHLLHIFPTFTAAGAQVRTITVLNALGPAFHHSFLSIDGKTDAAVRLSTDLRYDLIPAPQKSNLLGPLRFKEVLDQVQPDLLLTYNWGAMDAVAASLLARVPCIHTEDGFGADEAEGLKPRRVWTRRILLNRIFRTVVPSLTLQTIALKQFKLRPELLTYIPNGVDASRFQPSEKPSSEKLVFGFVGHLREEKNLPLLIRAFEAAEIPGARLVIAGGGPLEADLKESAAGLPVEFLGPVADTAKLYPTFDVFVMSSSTEQMPMSLLEAMACGLPCLVTNVGDCRKMLQGGIREAVPCDDLPEYVRALQRLASEPDTRLEFAAKNRRIVLDNYSESKMVEAWGALYRAALE